MEEWKQIIVHIVCQVFPRTSCVFRFNQTNYRARVAVVTSSEQVSEFCQDICTRLKVCPYLFGPTRVEAGNCPENCNVSSKSKFST